MVASTFLAATTLLAGACHASAFLPGSQFGRPGFPASFDYVVVGGGTAGLAVAHRLAESGTCSVAVIEAGGFYEQDNGNLSTVPAFTSRFVGKNPKLKNPLVDWQQRTTPQTALTGETMLYTSGKTLGGGSARNFFFYHRASKGSHDVWANKTGDPSYTWSSFFPFSQRSVKLNAPNSTIRPSNASVEIEAEIYATSSGPVQVSFANFANSISSYFGPALTQVGIKEIPGFLSGNLFGWQYTPLSIDPVEQTRSSSESAYLSESFRESTMNLYVYKSTLAKKIVFDGATATGVVVDSSGVTYQISAKKEIVLSAGAFRSPQLLMVSGIGPREQLAQHNIPVISDLPGVGQNLWDQLIFGPSYQVNLHTHAALADPAYFASQVDQYNNNRTGILTNSAGDIIAFEKLPSRLLNSSIRADLDRTFGQDWPDIELVAFDGFMGDEEELGNAPSAANYVTVAAVPVAPFSRGTVGLASNDTADNPIVDMKWMQDPRDVAIGVAALKRCREIANTTSFRDARIGNNEAFPGYTVSSDTDLEEYVRRMAQSVYHAAGTNAMGMQGDRMAVVDSKARVFGVEGLRVVDASVLPVLLPGHPQATVYGLAEKIAEDIKRA